MMVTIAAPIKFPFIMFGIIALLRAARLGIEPRLEASKAPVLPLDDLAMNLI